MHGENEGASNAQSKGKKRGSKIRFRKTISKAPQTSEDRQESIRLLARFIAKAYMADHPELFQRKHEDEVEMAEIEPQPHEGKESEFQAA